MKTCSPTQFNIRSISCVFPVYVARNISEDIIKRKIFYIVNREYDVTELELKSKSRDQRICKARFLYIMLMKKFTKISNTQLGKELGGRDHSTITNAIQTFQGHMKVYPQYKFNFDKLVNKIQGSIEMDLIHSN